MAELLLRAIAALVVVSGLIYLSGHLLKKAQAAGLIRVAASGRRMRLRLLETARLGPDSYLHLVQVDDRTVLVAMGRGGVAVSATEADAPPDADVREVNAS